MPRQQESSYSRKVVKRRPDGTERVLKIGNEDPATCDHYFIKHKYKFKPVVVYRERCPKCGKYSPLWQVEEKNRTGWTDIQKTLERILQVAEEVRDWRRLRPRTVEKILKNEKSAAWSYYATLIEIINLEQTKKKKGLYIQPRTLKKLVFLFEKLDCQNFTWQEVRSALKSSFEEECSRSTAKRFETVIRHLNAKIPAA